MEQEEEETLCLEALMLDPCLVQQAF